MSIKFMMYRKLIFIALMIGASVCWGTDTFCQSSNLYGIDIIEQIIRDKQDTARIYYVDSARTKAWFDPQSLNRKNYKNLLYRELNGNRIFLPRAERKFLLAEIERMKHSHGQNDYLGILSGYLPTALVYI